MTTFDCDDESVKRRLDNLLTVCKYSGYRRMGIAKALDENREFLELLLGSTDSPRKEMPVGDYFPWMERCTQAHDCFMESLLAAIRPTFPDVGFLDSGPINNFPRRWRGRYYEDDIMWSEMWMQRKDVNYLTSLMEPKDSLRKCHKRVMAVVIPELSIRKEDHLMLMRSFSMYCKESSYGFGISWLENIYLFFLDIWKALELDDFYQSDDGKNMRFPDARERIEKIWHEITPLRDIQGHHDIPLDMQ